MIINFYQRFIKNAVQISAPLNNFLRDSKRNDNHPVLWTEKGLEAFQKCKDNLLHATTLAYHTPADSLSIMVDASDIATGAVLQSHTPESMRPLSLFLRKLSPTEQWYSTYDRETAVYSAMKHFRHNVEGRDFTIYTHHKLLIYALYKKPESGSLCQLRQLDYFS